ncbi:MFS transporter [Pseudomonas sp. NPDC007930]|uniref:MFS transporter n=1 Tax=Pseudomonas sp. NPDC007930 TaxID=3364417 RepID=UPI0036E6119D
MFKTIRIAPLLVLLVLVSLLAVFPLDVMLPSVSAMAGHFSVAPQAITANIALFPIAYAFGQLLVGAAADRYGLRVVMALAVAISALAALAAATATSYGAFNAWRVLQALGCAGFGLLHAVVQAHYPAAQRATVRIGLTMLGGICLSMSPLLGVCLQVLGGWQLSFWVYAALALAVALAVPLCLPAAGQQQPALAHTGALATSRFAHGALAASLAFSVHFLFIVVSPLLFIERRGLSLWAYAGVMLVYGGFYLLGGLVALRVAKALDTQQQIRAGFSLIMAAGVLMLGLYLYTGLQAWVALLVAVIATCGVCIARPAANCLAMDAWPGRPGAAAGWLGMLTFMGGGVLSLIASALLGLGDQWLVAWLVVLAGAGLALAMRRGSGLPQAAP